MAERLAGEMKAGSRDKPAFWIDLEMEKGEPKHKASVEFYALRGEDGKYLGCWSSLRACRP